MSRRRLLSVAAALGIAGCARTMLAAGAPSLRQGAPPIGLQLYTLGGLPEKDLEGTLQIVADIGYDTVEFPGPYNRSPRQIRNALDRVGLVCPSFHFPFQSVLPGGWDLSGDLTRVADDIKTIGASYVVVGGPNLPDSEMEMLRRLLAQPRLDLPKISEIYGSLSPDDWTRTGDLLNEKGGILARSGLRIAYHNHAWEFLELPNGTTGYSILLERTDPQVVDFQLDVGWAASAGEDSVALVKNLGQRLRLLHLKDTKNVSSDSSHLASADIGTGIVDWDHLIPAIKAAGVPHLFVEQEPPFPVSCTESVRIAYDFLLEAFANAI